MYIFYLCIVCINSYILLYFHYFYRGFQHSNITVEVVLLEVFMQIQLCKDLVPFVLIILLVQISCALDLLVIALFHLLLALELLHLALERLLHVRIMLYHALKEICTDHKVQALWLVWVSIWIGVKIKWVCKTFQVSYVNCIISSNIIIINHCP